MNDQLNPTIPLGGSSIFGPMDKFRAVGHGKYAGFYITVYMHAANFAESSTRSSANELRYAEFVFFLSPWSLLFGGQHRVGAVVPFLKQ